MPQQRVLVVSTASPYPVVTNGCARLVSECERSLFADADVTLLHARAGDWDIDRGVLDAVLAENFDFVLFIGFKDTKSNRELAARWPAFCFTDRVPHPDVPEDVFRGILAHRADGAKREDVVLVGGCYDDRVFFPDLTGEDIVVSVGRIHPEKNQLELVERYREAVFDAYGLPLHLVGGVDDDAYWQAVSRYVDGDTVIATGKWQSAAEIAALCNRARAFVSASPREAFGLALVEAMACGTTCVVNGSFTGFAADELAAHVYGNVGGKRGSVVDLVADVLRDDVRVDASEWARRYAVPATRSVVAAFIGTRL